MGEGTGKGDEDTRIQPCPFCRPLQIKKSCKFLRPRAPRYGAKAAGGCAKAFMFAVAAPLSGRRRSALALG